MSRISADMGAHKTVWRAIQGDSFTWTFTLRSNGEPVDFTDCEALLQIRERFGHQETRPALIELTETSGIGLNGDTGIVIVNLSPAQTQELGTNVNRARFQLRVTDTVTGIAATILRGEIRLEPSVILPVV